MDIKRGAITLVQQVDYPSVEELDESRVITEQSFDVVSSGKTSWSATGNEKYYEVTGEK